MRKASKIVGWGEAPEALARRFDLFESLLLHLKIGFDIDMGRLQTFMASQRVITVMSTPDCSRCMAVVWR